MCSAVVDDDKHDLNDGYLMLIDKQINKYERIFVENECKLNRYKHTEHPITITDNGHSYHKRNCDDIEELNETQEQLENQTQTDKQIYANQYREWIHYHFDYCSPPTSSYTCLWDTCRYECPDYAVMCQHLSRKHMNELIQDDYVRSFVQLNQYRYQCTHTNCDYQTSILDHIVKHRNLVHYNACSFNCGRFFRSKQDLSDHERSMHYYYCSFRGCGKQFPNKKALNSHETTPHKFIVMLRKNIVHMNFRRKQPSNDETRKNANALNENSVQTAKNSTKFYYCSFSGCGKKLTSIRTLISHERTHSSVVSCCFKPDDEKYLKDKSVCGYDKIKKYFQKRKVIDGSDKRKVWYRYKCLWSDCRFDTYRYENIQKHVHDEHTCPLIVRQIDSKTISLC